jgi:hypothetical protein
MIRKTAGGCPELSWLILMLYRRRAIRADARVA